MGDGSIWQTGDIITKSRMNLKTLLIDSGTNISGYATPVEGQMAYCNSTSAGFTQGITYFYDLEGAWQVFGQVGASQVADLYDTTIGDYTTPTSATASTTATTTVTTIGTYPGASTATGWSTFVFAGLITGLTPGAAINTVGVKINSGSGNFRVKLYQDNGASGGAGTLLTESASTASTSGVQYIQCTTNTVVPASGNVWVAMETDSGTISLFYGTGGGDKVSHSYGAGPSPFGSITSVTNVPYMELANTLTFVAANVYDTITTTEWKSTSAVNPNIYVDMGSALMLTACAIYWDGTNTTATNILVQTSPDASTWTTVRTINTNLFTNGAWNYFRWNIPATTLNRYVRFYGNDGGAKVLAIWEIKIKEYANTSTGAFSFISNHGHPFISPTVATTPLTA